MALNQKTIDRQVAAGVKKAPVVAPIVQAPVVPKNQPYIAPTGVPGNAGQMGKVSVSTQSSPYGSSVNYSKVGAIVNAPTPKTSWTPQARAAWDAANPSATAPSDVRLPPTGPTKDNAVVTVGAPPSEPTGAPTMRDINIKRLKGEQLTDEDLNVLLDESERERAAQLKATQGDYKGVTDVYQQQIAAGKSEYEAERAAQKAEREQLLAQRGQALDTQLGRDVGRARESGQLQSQAVQSALSFSGFGRSTYNADKQALIARDVSDREEILGQQRNLELETYRRELEGEDEAILAPMRQRVDELKIQSANFEIEAAQKVAELNQKNKVSGNEAIDNLIKTLSPAAKKGYDKDLTEMIKDGYVYRMGKNGLPERLTSADGTEIKTGVDESKSSDLEWTAPKVDMFGNTIPGYLFDKKTRTLTQVDPVTGSQTVVQTNNPQQAIVNFKNFDEYSKTIGNGTIVKGSPYHKSFEVDIDGSIDDPISALTGGRVVEADSVGSGGFGKTVVIEDYAGNRIRYAHLNGVTVNNGDLVGAGQFIGPMGNTGNVKKADGGDGSHLHIEARNKNGELISLSDISPSNMFNYNTSNQRVPFTGSPDQVNEMYRKGWGASPASQAAYKKIINEGGVAADLNAQEAERKRQEELKKPMSSEAAAKYSMAKDGFNFSNQYESLVDQFINTKGDITKMYIDPKFAALRGQISDLIGRMRSGGAINADEEKRFKSYLGSPLDFAVGNPKENIKFKLKLLKSGFESVRNSIRPEDSGISSQGGGVSQNEVNNSL